MLNKQETQNSLFTVSEIEAPRAKTCPGPGVKPGLTWCPGLLPLCGGLTLTSTLPPQQILLSTPPPTESKRLQGGDHKSLFSHEFIVILSQFKSTQ